MKKTRRNHSAASKAKVALAALAGEKTIAKLAQHFQVYPKQVTAWKAQLAERAVQVFGAEPEGPDLKPMVKELHADRQRA
jgi:transposase